MSETFKPIKLHNNAVKYARTYKLFYKKKVHLADVRAGFLKDLICSKAGVYRHMVIKIRRKFYPDEAVPHAAN